jgi:hypothetical protein
MAFPKETKLFGLTMADIRGTGKSEIILIDELNRLNLLSEDGKTVWRGRDRFGGTNNYYDTKRKIVPGFRQEEFQPWRVYIPGRILTKDLDGDGLPEVIVSKNDFGSGLAFERVRIIEKAEIHDLAWEDDYLATNWKTKEIRGYIADYQVKDVDNDGEDELVVAAIAPEEGAATLFSKNSKSNIYFFKLF